jgi:hypothetical protein
MPTIAAPLIAAPDNSEAIQQGEIEAALRRRRAGAAANILTSPVGIPATRKLGGMAA